MGQPKDVELRPEVMKFGQEGFLRRLFRGELEEDSEGFFKDEDIEVQFVSGTSGVKPKHISALLNVLPLSKHIGTWDEEAVEKYLLQKCGSEGTVGLKGTALMLLVRKQ
eukprot:1463307-Amphidinium_carterae.1